jgi:prepilin-type processing-associated H-X9-DG protein
MYSGENRDKFPHSGAQGGLESGPYDPDPHDYVWDMDWQTIPWGPSFYPEYLSDLNIYFCPSDPEDPDDYLDCSLGSNGLPKGDWCGGRKGGLPSTHPRFGQIDIAEFEDASYLYYGFAVDSPQSWATMITILSGPSPFYALVDGFDHVAPAYAGGDPNEAFNVYWDILDSDIGIYDAQYGPGWSESDIVNFMISESEGRIEANGGQIYASGAGASDSIPRLKEGVERFMITDINNPAGAAMAQSTLPVMWDFVDDDDDFSHSPGGANVLYMDGHVAFIRYPGEAPVNRPTARTFTALHRG